MLANVSVLWRQREGMVGGNSSMNQHKKKNKSRLRLLCCLAGEN